MNKLDPKNTILIAAGGTGGGGAVRLTMRLAVRLAMLWEHTSSSKMPESRIITSPIINTVGHIS